jgi:hypothetical protein
MFKNLSLGVLLVIGNHALVCQDLAIASGGLLYLSPGAVVTAGGNFSNAGTVTLDASTTAYSQLKISGTATGNVVQSQYLEAGSHLISSPVSEGFTTTSGDEEKLYSYDATAGNWAAIGDNFATAGLGFAARVDATQIPFLTAAANVSVTGTPNTSMTHTLGFYNGNYLASTGSGTGWNLIGNPYTCGLDWSTVLPLTNVNSAFYIWDPAGSGSYKYYSPSAGTLTSVIPPMQAFWVQATQAGASISTTMDTNGTVSSSPTYYKTIPDNLIVTVTKAGDSATTDRLWVANIQGTGDGFDGAYDAWKMTNGPTMPNVFTWDLGERIAINAIEIDAAKVLPMGFSYAVAATKFGVSLEQVTGGQYYDVYLEDKLTGSYHDLNQSDYSFTHQGWTQEGPRFALHFSLSTVGVEEPNAADRFVAYQNQDRIVLRSSETGFSAYRLYGLNGQELSRGPLTPGMQSIAAPTSAGLYFIEAYGPQGSLRQKIIIVH